MSKVRINDLARELEVKSRPILDALEAIGVTGKTHSSSIEADQAERVREYFKNGGKSSTATRQPVDTKPKFDLSKVSKPGDALKAILERKQAEAAAKAAPPRPTAVVAPPASVPRRRRCCTQGRCRPPLPGRRVTAPDQLPRQHLPRPVASSRCPARRRTSSCPPLHRPSRASLPSARSSRAHLWPSHIRPPLPPSLRL